MQTVTDEPLDVGKNKLHRSVSLVVE